MKFSHKCNGEKYIILNGICKKKLEILLFCLYHRIKKLSMVVSLREGELKN